MATQMRYLVVDGVTYEFDATKFNGEEASYYATQGDIERIEALVASNLEYKSTIDGASSAPGTAFPGSPSVGDL